MNRGSEAAAERGAAADWLIGVIILQEGSGCGASLLLGFGLRYRQSLLSTPLESERCRTTSRISQSLPFLAVNSPRLAPPRSLPRIRSTAVRTALKPPPVRR